MSGGIFARIEYTDGTHGTYLVYDWGELWKKIGSRPVDSIEAHREGANQDAGTETARAAGTCRG